MAASSHPPDIRPFAAEDRHAVLQLVELILSAFGFGSNVRGIQRDLDSIAAVYSGERARFWVAELDRCVVGTVAIRPKEEHTCELKRLYVHPDVRGRGIGQQLYAHAERFARDARYERIWLDSSRRFAQARRLYERNGFVLLEELDNDWEDNVYEKSL